MPLRVVWTAELDGQLRALRAAGLTWDAIARDMDLGRNTVLERGRRLGARRLRPVPVFDAAELPDRPARPPGHPSSWAAINAGTVLEGQPYPYPVFL